MLRARTSRCLIAIGAVLAALTCARGAPPSREADARAAAPRLLPAVYRADLERYPRNGWSLYGLAASLRAQHQRAKAEWAQQGFTAAWARADVPLHASRF